MVAFYSLFSFSSHSPLFLSLLTCCFGNWFQKVRNQLAILDVIKSHVQLKRLAGGTDPLVHIWRLHSRAATRHQTCKGSSNGKKWDLLKKNQALKLSPVLMSRQLQVELCLCRQGRGDSRVSCL